LATERKSLYNCQPAGDFPALRFKGVDMSTMVFPDLPNGIHPKHSETLGIGRRPAAVALASSLWPSSSELFTEDFLTDSLDEDSNELGNLLAQIEAFSGSVHSGASDLFKFRELLLEADHSVFNAVESSSSVAHNGAYR